MIGGEARRTQSFVVGERLLKPNRKLRIDFYSIKYENAGRGEATCPNLFWLLSSLRPSPRRLLLALVSMSTTRRPPLERMRMHRPLRQPPSLSQQSFPALLSIGCIGFFVGRSLFWFPGLASATCRHLSSSAAWRWRQHFSPTARPPYGMSLTICSGFCLSSFRGLSWKSRLTPI